MGVFQADQIITAVGRGAENDTRTRRTECSEGVDEQLWWKCRAICVDENRAVVSGGEEMFGGAMENDAKCRIAAAERAEVSWDVTAEF